MTVYAVRRKSDKQFFSVLKKPGRGTSHYDPMPGIPRLFSSARTAKCFITVWCKGPSIAPKYKDWETGYLEVSNVQYIKGHGRKPEDLEIVEMNLSEVK